jgi:hypothetical protein
VSRVNDGSRFAPHIDADFSRPDRGYSPGEALGVRYRVRGLGEERIKAIEHAVAWYTEGKGEEDLGVHFFERIEDAERFASAVDETLLEVTLPESPLSYEGLIVKIRWCIRVRVFFEGGRDFISEHVFDVGTVPPARPPEEA